MVKLYRAIHQWNHWLTHFLGKNLLELERETLVPLMAGNYRKSALLLGVPHQISLLQANPAPCQFLLSPLIHQEKNIHYIEGEFYELPIQSGSVDQVILPHTLEHLDNPYQLLTEACRIVKPEGHIYILGFNPYSMWGIKKLLMQNKHIPWSGNFIKPSQVKKWLSLADFELLKQEQILFRPPTTHINLFKKLKFLEAIGNKCYKAFGGVYIIQAKAKVIPLTPIRLHWTQELSGIRISTKTIPGPTIRNHS